MAIYLLCTHYGSDLCGVWQGHLPGLISWLGPIRVSGAARAVVCQRGAAAKGHGRLGAGGRQGLDPSAWAFGAELGGVEGFAFCDGC